MNEVGKRGNSLERELYMTVPSVKELLEFGVHFGHQTSRWHPKMEPFIFGKRQNVHIIDLEKTQVYLEQAMQAAKDIVAKGGTILFVGTKKQAQEVVEAQAKACSMPYVNGRWVGGTLTNFSVIRTLIKHYNDMVQQSEKGGFEKYTKKERLEIQRKIEKKKDLLTGLVGLTKMPDALFVLDVKTEKTAMHEAESIGIPIFAICDTNVNPKPVKYVIPANDDATKSLEIIAKSMAEAINEGLAERESTSAEAEKPAAEPTPIKETTNS